MSAYPIDPHIAVIARIHPRAAMNYIEALHTIDAILAPLGPVPDTRLSSIQTVASNSAEKQAAIEDVAIGDVSAPSTPPTVNGVNHEPTVTAALVADVVLGQDASDSVAGEGAGGGQLDSDDKLTWLADAANNASDDPRDKLFDTVNVVPKAAPRQPRLTLSTDALEKYLAKMSWQRRDAFTWLDKNIEAVLQADIDNELSFRKAMTDINKGKPKSRQISHETVRKAFNDYCKVSDYEAVKMSAS
jgi:hypothetical protein